MPILVHHVGVSLFIAALALMFAVRYKRCLDSKADKSLESSETRNQHEIAEVYFELVAKDGAGFWPPRARHYSWPEALSPYRDIYLKMIPELSTENPSLEDTYNVKRRDKFRTRMQKLMKESIDITKVQRILTAVEAGNWEIIDREAYNGFYSCIANSRHVYRWATIPVVKVAQREKIIDFPIELAAPWPYLQRHFGVIAESGNHTSNVLLNFDKWDTRNYRTNVGVSKIITSTEDCFFRMILDVEKQGVPAYRDMMEAVVAFEENDNETCLDCLRGISFRLRVILKSYFDNMNNSRISHAHWMSYVQGMEAWAAGQMINNEYLEYDGLSGNQILFFQALDAFLGIDCYLTAVDSSRYIPVRQRNFCTTIRKHSFRHRLEPEKHWKMMDAFTTIVNQLKVFRATHRKRSMKYLHASAPERMIMTAGKSVLEVEGCKDLEVLLKPLDDLMVSRLNNTV